MKHDYRDRRVGAWDWDVVNDRVVADERFAELYSVHPVLAAAGGPIAEFFRSMHHDDRAAVVAAINRAIQTREAFSEEYRLIQRDGSIRWVLAEGQCTYSDDGTPLRFPGYVFDITSRKSAEKELKADERQALLRAHARSRIWESTPDLLAAIKLDGRFQYSNPAWQHTLSWTEVDLADCSFFDLASPKGRTELITAFSEMRADDPIFRLLCKCRSKDSSYRLISWVAVLDGDLIHCIGRDVVATEMVATLSTFRDDT